MNVENLKEALRQNNDYRCHLEERIQKIYSLLGANSEKQVTCYIVHVLHEIFFYCIKFLTVEISTITNKTFS